MEKIRQVQLEMKQATKIQKRTHKSSGLKTRMLAIELENKVLHENSRNISLVKPINLN